MGEDIKRVNVEDCILKDITQGIELPVTRFDVTFKLDEIPTLNVVPALGRDLFNKVENEFNKMRERDEVELIITLDGVDTTIMTGFVSSISGSDNAGLFKRTVSATIAIKHKAVALATSPPLSTVFTGNASTTLTQLDNKKKMKYVVESIRN